MRNLLLPAIFEDLHFFGLEIGDDLPVLVGDHRIDLHQIRGDAHHVDFFRLLCLRSLGRRRRGG